MNWEEFGGFFLIVMGLVVFYFVEVGVIELFEMLLDKLGGIFGEEFSMVNCIL